MRTERQCNDFGALRIVVRCMVFAVVMCILATELESQTIQGVKVFRQQKADGPAVVFFLEISGQGFGEESQLGVFLAPQRGIVMPPVVVSQSDTAITARLVAVKDYVPETVLVTGPEIGGVSHDLRAEPAPPLGEVAIRKVEILELDREAGKGRISIEGSGFGTDLDKVRVIVVPHNPKLATSVPTIKHASDTVIVAEFSFPHGGGYSQPFRIARVLVVVTKPTPAGISEAHFTSHELAPLRDPNLTYRYTILSTEQAKSRFGRGIAKNFYVIQLSIVNEGQEKLQVPLAGVEVEVEWAAGEDPKTRPPTTFEEGPATVSPVPLAGVVSFFSHDRRYSGHRARFFNILQGLVTVGSGIQKFFGPGFAEGVSIAGGAFTQGLEKVFPDLSEEQLANLTSQSFESIQSVSQNGGSIEKVVFIQRGLEVIEPYNKKVLRVRRLITGIRGLQITGYEAPETEARAGTPLPEE